MQQHPDQGSLLRKGKSVIDYQYHDEGFQQESREL